jgi:hypothetical protein
MMVEVTRCLLNFWRGPCADPTTAAANPAMTPAPAPGPVGEVAPSLPPLRKNLLIHSLFNFVSCDLICGNSDSLTTIDLACSTRYGGNNTGASSGGAHRYAASEPGSDETGGAAELRLEDELRRRHAHDGCVRAAPRSWGTTDMITVITISRCCFIYIFWAYVVSISYIAGQEKSDTFCFFFSASGEYAVHIIITVLAFVRESFRA